MAEYNQLGYSGTNSIGDLFIGELGLAARPRPASSAETASLGGDGGAQRRSVHRPLGLVATTGPASSRTASTAKSSRRRASRHRRQPRSRQRQRRRREGRRGLGRRLRRRHRHRRRERQQDHPQPPARQRGHRHRDRAESRPRWSTTIPRPATWCAGTTPTERAWPTSPPCSSTPDDRNCFAGNAFSTSAPANIEQVMPCEGAGTGDPNAARSTSGSSSTPRGIREGVTTRRRRCRRSSATWRTRRRRRRVPRARRLPSTSTRSAPVVVEPSSVEPRLSRTTRSGETSMPARARRSSKLGADAGRLQPPRDPAVRAPALRVLEHEEVGQGDDLALHPVDPAHLA